MHLRFPVLWLTTLLCLGSASPAVSAAGRVELELVTEGGAPITAQQEWLRRLAQVGVSNLRIRTKRALDRVGIERQGTESAPIYKVTGIITAGGELLMPEGRYRARDAARLAQWLDDLAKLGPPEERPKKTAFGFTVEEFQQVHDGLAQSVGFPTKDLPRREVIEEIAKRLLIPLRADPELTRALKDDDVVFEELSGVSCGTALAYLVRPLGFALVPRTSAGRGAECVLTKARPNMEAWPVGWEPEKRLNEILPGFFESLNVNVQGVPVTRVIEAVSGRLEVPALLDYNAMARHGVEPEKAIVSLPQPRTSYLLLLKRCLGQAKLKYELRLDEADKPFFWITTIKPL